MVTATQIIDDAFREENIIGVGTSPTTNEQTEALRRLNALIESLIGIACGEQLTDWYIPTLPNTSAYYTENPNDPYDENSRNKFNLTPPVNARLLCKLTEATEVFLPKYPSDGTRILVLDIGSTNTALTLNPQGRLIDGASSVTLDLSTDAPREYFYRADLGQWTLRPALALGDDLPFPPQFDDLFVLGLCLRLCRRYGKTPAQQTFTDHKALLTKFRARYKQYTPTPSTFNLGNVQSSGTYGNSRGFDF